MTTWGAWSSNGHTDLGVDWSYSGQTLNVTVGLATHWSYSGNSCTLSWGGTWGGSAGMSITRSNPSSAAIWTGSFTQAYGTTATLNFSMTGFYEGAPANCSVSLSSYLAPLPPSTGQVTLSTTNFTVSDGITVGATVRCFANRPAGDQVRGRWQFGTATGYIPNSFDPSGVLSVSADSMDWTPTAAMLAAQIPNAASGSGVVFMDYYDSTASTYYGYTQMGFTATLPTTTAPALTTVTNAESGTGGVALTGKYVQNYSAVQFTLTGPGGITGVYGSTITSCIITVNGVGYPITPSSPSVTISPVTFSGTGVSVTGSATDSRGRTSTVTAPSVNVLPYAPPAISSFSFQRWNAGTGLADGLGTSVKVTSAGSATTLASTLTPAQRNSLTWKIETQPTSGGSWTVQKTTTIPQGTSTLSWTAPGDVLGGGALSTSQSYNVRLTATDAVNATASVLLLPVGTVTLSMSQTGVGVGKIQTPERVLDVGGTAYVDGDLLVTGSVCQQGSDESVNPVGMITPYAVPGHTPPGWLLCDGAAYSRAAYARLYGYIGGTYGANNANGSYNIAKNPRAVSSGTSVLNNNDPSAWAVAWVTAFPVAHPLGITTGVQSHIISAGIYTASASLYNLDGWYNSCPWGARYVGIYVMTQASGYRVAASSYFPATPLTAGVWTFVQTTSPMPAANYTGIIVEMVFGTPAPSGDIVYFTGVIASTDPSVVSGGYFDPITYRSPYVAAVWSGSVNASATLSYVAGFNVPNLNGRVPVGAGNSGATGATTHMLAQTGGEETHTNTVAEMVPHNHSLPDSHYSATATNPGAYLGSSTTAAFWTNNGTPYTSSNGTGSNGSGAAMNNMQPYLGLNFLIKT